MKHGSLFSGIGGFDYAAQLMGWENVFHCEWNPFGQQVLKHYFPNSISYEDITKTDFSVHRGNIDIITGGFPCQPYSAAGKRLGKADERHLFPEMLRAIKEIKPKWIIGENVRGLISWNGGMVFHEVYDDLEREGYEVQSFLIPAASVGAPHKRDRIWYVAYSNDYGCKTNGGEIRKESGVQSINREEMDSRMPDGADISKVITDTNSNGLEGGLSSNLNRQVSSEKKYDEERLSIFGQTIPFQNFPTVSPICDGDDGLSERLDNITFSKWRTESIKAGGNAIVPQVGLQIFRTIEAFENLQKI